MAGSSDLKDPRILFGALGLALLLATPVAAEVKTWTWNGSSALSSNPGWGGHINTAANWKDESGNTGVPARGDTVKLAKTSGILGWTSNNQAATKPWGDVYWTTSGASQFFLCVEAGHKLQIGGSWTGTTGLYLYGDGETEIESTSGVDLKFQKPFEAKEGRPTLVKNGKWTLICYYQAGSRVYTIPVTKIKQGTINITTTKAQNDLLFLFDGDDPSQCLEYTCKDGNTTHTDDLVLGNSAIIETNGVANTGHSISSSYGAQLVFTGTPKVNPMVFSGRFANKAGLRWSPASDAFTFICSNATSTTTGKMTVEKGTLKLVTGATFTALSELAVSGGAAVDVEAGAGVDFRADNLTLDAATARFNLADGVLLTFNAASLAGAALPPGVYSAEGVDGTRVAPWIAGAGRVQILTGPASADTWVGADADGDALTLDGNWQKGGTPDLGAGDLLAMFAAGGTSATLSGTARFDGLVLQNGFGGSAFTFACGADARAEVGVTGLTVGNATSATTWTMNWPLALVRPQTWSVGANNTLDLAGGLSGTDALTVDSAGTIGLLSQSSHSGALTLNSGTYNVSVDQALGAASRTVAFDHSTVRYAFSGTTTQQAPMTSEKFVTTEPGTPFLSVAEDADVTFKGRVKWTGHAKMALGKNAMATFAGGLQAVLSAVYGHLHLTGSGTLVVTNASMNIARQLHVPSGQSVAVDFRVADNRISSGDDWCEFYSGKMFTHVPNAFADGQILRLGTTTWDLCSKDQRLGLLATSASGSAVRSDGPATLTLTSNTELTNQGGVNRVNYAVFSGMVSLVKNGSAPHAIGAESPTAGTMTVSKGVLKMTAKGRWPNCAEVNATGGTLVLENDQAFAPDAVWRVGNGATVSLDNVGTNACEKLYFDGQSVGGGIFGALGSGAPREVAWITGTGFLKVPLKGTTLLFR